MYLCLLILFNLAFTSARVHPYLYGVPRLIDIEDNHLAEIDPLGAAANSTSSNGTTATPSSTSPFAQLSPGLAEPCAVVSSALAALPSDARRVVPADLGLQCLESVPLDKDGNLLLINELKLYLQWQSNLAYLKNPPSGYTEAPVDILTELDKIAERLSADAFQSEYQFQLELMDLIEKGYDNHLAWQPDIVAAVMQFQRTPGTELISISADGRGLPEIFAYRDVELANNDSSFKPSAIRTINGQDVLKYLEAVALQADFHDADTRWNALFPSQAMLASGVNYLGAFRSGKYAGPSTTIVFANGTSRTDTNLAVVFGNFTGVDSGRTFFDTFCTGSPPPPVMTTRPSSSKAPSPTQTGYPEPVVIHPDGAIAGYYLEGEGYEDVAVLSIPSFLSPDVNLFQSMLREFIGASVDAGKTKLVFDMRGNGGGNAVLGLDTFKQVFPQSEMEPFVASRYRAHEALNMAGRLVSDFNQGRTFVQQNDTAFDENFAGSTPEELDLYTSVFNYEHNLNIDLEGFESWEEMYGPVTFNNDRFTARMRYNLSDVCSYTYPGFSVTGFLNNTEAAAAPQPFRAENMVMLHDGMCSSTCAIVSELLKTQGGVKTVVLGGRPQFGPMQGVGGTKGAQSFEWDDIQIRTGIIFSFGSPEQQEAWNKTALGKTAFASQIFRRTSYNGGRPSGGINLRDSIRRDDESQTPLEFVYDAADCRLWFTAAMVHDVRVVWKQVVDSMWKKQRCVQGSTGDQSSVSGGGGDGSGRRSSGQQGGSSHSTRMLPSYGLLGWSMASGIMAGLVWR